VVEKGSVFVYDGGRMRMCVADVDVFSVAEDLGA
jgi:hypothetical protein